EERLAMVTRELGVLAPDVVGLQEASITRGRGNVAARLATALGLHVTHASATRRVSGLAWIDWLIVWGINFEEGPAILSRFPIVATHVVDLPRCRRFYDPRVLLHAVVQTPRGPLDVFAPHTGHDARQVRRGAPRGSARSRAAAVWRLMTSSKRGGRSPAMSATRAPRSARSTIAAARRKVSGRLGPRASRPPACA